MITRTIQGLGGVAVSTKDYHERVAYSLISRFLDDFLGKYPDWRKLLPTEQTEVSSSNIQFPELEDYLKKYQNPREADNIMRVQEELDETKKILVRSFS
jgi:synaptobrevin family protein YKT6